MKKVTYLILSLFVLAACQSKNERDKLYDEVMAVHDEVMPKMDDVMELKSSINKEIEKLSSQDSTSQSRIKKLEAAKKQLEEVDGVMMDWMRGFKTDYDDMAKEEVLDYLKVQKSRIEKVGEKMDQAINYAKTLLNNKEDNDKGQV